MAERLANNFQTVVDTGGITSSATSLPVVAAAIVDLRNPAGKGADFTIRVEDADGSGKPAGTNIEYMRVTDSGAAGASPWTVTRESEDAARFPKVAHAAGSIVTHILTSSNLKALLELAGTPLWSPQMEGFLAMAWDPAQNETNSSGGSQELFLTRIATPYQITPSNIHTQVHTAGSTFTLMKLGIYSAAGVLIAQSADLSAAFATNGFKTAALTAEAGQSLSGIGGASKTDYLLGAWLFVGTTSPKFFTPGGLDTNMFSNNLTAAALTGRGMKATGKSSLPGTLTPSDFQIDGNSRMPWMALS